MDRSKKTTRTAARRFAGYAVLCALGLAFTDRTLPSVGRAQTAAPAPSRGTMTWAEAVVQTRSDGKPTVLAVTSKAVPRYTALTKALLASPAVTRLKQQVNVAELCAEDEPEQIKRIQAAGYPTFIALRRGADGTLELAGSFRGTLSPDELTGWVLGLGLVKKSPGAATSRPDGDVTRPAEATSRPDGDVTRAGLLHKDSPNPSPQAAPPLPPPAPPYYPPPVYQPPPQVYAPPPAPPQYVVEQPQEREYEVVIEQPQEREYEIVVEQPQEREVVIAQPREVVIAQPREVVIAQPLAAAPRNVLTRSAAPPLAPRDATPPSAPRTVLVRETAPREAAPRTGLVREAAPREAAPRTVLVREAAPREVAPRTVALATAPREARAAQPALRQPGFLARAIGRVGSRVAEVGWPRVEVQTQTTYTMAPEREVSVVTQAAPRPSYAPPPPVYAPPPVPPNYPPPVPPWAPTPQHSFFPSPQTR